MGFNSGFKGLRNYSALVTAQHTRRLGFAYATYEA